MKNEIKTLDNYWRELVKLRAGNKCEMCSRTSYLNCHHIFSRSRKSVRWDENNGCCLCAGHHTLYNDSAHKAPLDFIEWLKTHRGVKWYNDLRLRANIPQKPDMKAIGLYLRESIKKLRKEQEKRKRFMS